MSADGLPPPTAACIVQAAQTHGLDPQVVGRELALRNGQRGMIYSTPEGGFEVGLMRIPSAALPVLRARGISQDTLAWDNCLNVHVAAEMLSVRIQQQGRSHVRSAAAAAVEPAMPPGSGLRMLPVAQEAPRPLTQPGGSRQQCVEAASSRYGVHPHVILAVMKTEGGTTGQVSRNTNGTYDMGLMQINSIHLPELAAMGITREQVIGNECTNIFVGTYKLRQAIDGGSEFWTGVSRYHSKTPSKGRKYLAKVVENLRHVTAAAASGGQL